MYRLLDKGLEQLTAIVFKMGEIAQKALTISINGFSSGRDTSEEIHDLSEILVSMAVEVEEKSFALIAKYQPVASDLRIINSYMKIAYDFERYGRYAWDISSICKRLGGLDKCEDWICDFIKDMGNEVLGMVRTSIVSLKDHDAALAQTLCETEKEVDEMYFRYLDTLVKDARITNQCTVSSILIVRYLERIADHASYIAEAIVYIATGRKTTLR